MSNVIVLSSSEDETESEPWKNRNELSEAKIRREGDFSLSELPQINFNEIIGNKKSKTGAAIVDDFQEDCVLSNFHGITGIKNSKIEATKEKTDCALSYSDTNGKNSNSQDGSQSDSDYESQNNFVDHWEQYMIDLKNKYNVQVDLSSDEDKLEGGEEEHQKAEKKGRKRAGKSKAEALEEKKRKQEERQQEKLKKQEEAVKQRALKQLSKKNRLQYNPDNCLKSMEIIFDEDIEKYEYFNDFVRSIEEIEVRYSVISQVIPKSITWNRSVENNYINERHEVCSDVMKIDEDQAIIVWDAQEIINHIHNCTLIPTISSLKLLVPAKKLTLVIYKVESYFKYIKSIKDRAVRDNVASLQGNRPSQKKSKTKADKCFENFPKISRKVFEECLVDIQLLHKVNSRLIETTSEMILLIHQYTKSLAQRPSKMEKRQESSQSDWYVSSDNRDTVKVDKDGNGLKRLWQQQLCQFTLMSLETSEAIVSVYKSPLQLIEAYAKCSPLEGEQLLKDIPIRRAAGPLTSIRKIGPELSKKVYIMFTAENGDLYLNE